MQINPTDGLHVEALDDFERVGTEELGHLSEVRRRRQIAVLAPLVVRRNAVIAPTLDIKREDIEAVRVVARLEQVVGILGGNTKRTPLLSSRDDFMKTKRYVVSE